MPQARICTVDYFSPTSREQLFRSRRHGAQQALGLHCSRKHGAKQSLGLHCSRQHGANQMQVEVLGLHSSLQEDMEGVLFPPPEKEVAEVVAA